MLDRELVIRLDVRSCDWLHLEAGFRGLSVSEVVAELAQEEIRRRLSRVAVTHVRLRGSVYVQGGIASEQVQKQA